MFCYIVLVAIVTQTVLVNLQSVLVLKDHQHKNSKTEGLNACFDYYSQVSCVL